VEFGVTPAEVPQQQLRPIAAALYAILSLVSLGIVLFVGHYLLNNPAVMASTTTSARAYYVLLAILGLAVAAFLFGALRSTARLTGNQFGYAIDLGGPVVIAVLVVAGGYYFIRVPEDFVLTVRLRSNPPITNVSKTSILVDLDGRRDRREFTTLGEAIVPSVPARFKGAKFPIQFQSETYRLTAPKTEYEIPDNAVLYLEVEKLANSEEGQKAPDLCDGSPVIQLRNSGWMAFQNHNFDAAERAANSLQKCDERDYFAYNMRGAVAFYRQKYDQAVHYFEKASQLAPNKPDLRNNLGDALIELALQSPSDKKAERLAKALDQYLSVAYPGDFSNYKIARAQLFSGDTGSALNRAKSVSNEYDYDGGRGKARILEGAIYLQMIKDAPEKNDELLRMAQAAFSEGVRSDRAFWTGIFVDGKINLAEPFRPIQQIYGEYAKRWM
jgi:tetratricopeptide (TPR) repeat protein